MIQRTYTDIHEDFRLNGRSYTKEQLRLMSIVFVRDGDEYLKKVGYFLLDWFFNNRDYIEVSTSGTTGIAKCVQIKKQFLVESAQITGMYLDIKPKDTALCCLSPDFIAGKMMLVRAFVLGLDIDIIKPSSNPLKGITKSYDLSAMTPMQAKNSLNQLTQIKKLILGGSGISPDLEATLRTFPNEIYSSYGMTETVSHIALRRLTEPHEEYYQAMPHTSFMQDERGCLVIKAPLVTDRILVTNDVVDFKSYKEFKWLSRIDNMINSGGFKIFPEKVEDKLRDFISAPFFIGGVKDSVFGKKAILVIQGAPFDTQPLKDAMEHFVKEGELLRYELPKEIIFLPKFEETPTGKIRRGETLLKITQN